MWIGRLSALLALTLLGLSVLPSGAVGEVRFAAPRFAALEAIRTTPAISTAGGIEKECKQVEVHGELEDDSRALALIPSYGKCMARAFGGIPAKLVLWGCGYLLHPTGARRGANAWLATIETTCPAPHVFEWNVYESHAAYEAGGPLCVTTMRPQRTAGFAELRNVDDGHREVSVRWRLRRIAYEAYGANLFCGLVPEAVKRDAWESGSAIVGATSLAGRRADFSVSG